MIRPGAMGIAMTDLFVSASAALMLVLAVLRPLLQAWK